jgi:hypothetical protein
LLSISYTILSCYVLNIVELPLVSVLFLSVLLALYSAIIGLLLFSGADDKVKGLTYAKALNVLALFAFTDLFPLRWLTVLSWFFPPYWITMTMKSPDSLLVGGIALAVHIGWLWILIIRYWRKES